jgi:uncharacterized membrane protein
MTSCGHLWAVGFDDTGRAACVRDEITRLAWEKRQLILRDAAVAVRYPDGSCTLNGEPFPVETSAHGGTAVQFMAALALGAPPLTCPAISALLATVGDSTCEVGISNAFVREVECLMKPGTSVLFVLDEVSNEDAILHALRGLGGTVLRTNVDLERAKLIQSTLAAKADATQPSDL